MLSKEQERDPDEYKIFEECAWERARTSVQAETSTGKICPTIEVRSQRHEAFQAQFSDHLLLQAIGSEGVWKAMPVPEAALFTSPTTAVKVSVPHDKGKKAPAPVDSGQTVDSTGS